MSSRETVVSQHLPFSVLFPEVHKLVTCALTRHFRVLHLRCIGKLLVVCAEKLTRYAVALPEKKSRFIAYIDIKDLRYVGEERIEGLVVYWRNNISTYDDPDIARVAYPKVFEYVRNQVLDKEPEDSLFSLSENDIASLVMLITKNTHVYYRGNKGLFNDILIDKTFRRWFNEIN
ncbi:MAG: hypothetical protein CO060_02255 [Candidatus Yonathbacteria bacterium CG_4_9_14_0_2_um_filter_43_16]|nr:MAG: hypothetical protein CO060_02255 [Candidatus Yonathbacteria bacterium CG_4_9_14_0_2_um_filter_43_16]